MISTTLIISVVIQLTLSYPQAGYPGPRPINPRRVYPRQVGKVNLRGGNPYPVQESVLDINQMVKEVQDIIKSNDSFPRLTRGEIIELIEDISRNEMNTLMKERDQKSVMLVMPYTANNVGPKQIEELFTKPPITKIINENTKFSNSEIDSLYKRRRRPVVKQPEADFGLDGTGFQYTPVEQNYVKRVPVRQDEATLQSYYPNYLEQNVESGPHYPSVRRVKVPVPRVVPEPARQTFASNPNYPTAQRVKSSFPTSESLVGPPRQTLGLNPNYLTAQRVKSAYAGAEGPVEGPRPTLGTNANYVAVQRVKSGFAGIDGVVDPTRQSVGLNPNYVTVKRVKTGVRKVPTEAGVSNLDYSSFNRQGIPVVESNQELSEVNPNYVTVRRVKVSGNRRVPVTDGFTTDHLNSPEGQQNYVIKRVKVPIKKPQLQPYQTFETHPYYSDLSHQNFFNGIDLDSAPSMKVEQFSPEKPSKQTTEAPQEELSPEEMKKRVVIPVEEDDFDSVLSPKIRQNIKTLTHYEKKPSVQTHLKSNPELPTIKRNIQDEKFAEAMKVLEELAPEVKRLTLNLTSTVLPSSTPATVSTTPATVSTTTQSTTSATTKTTATTTTTTTTTTTEKNIEVKPKYSSRIRQRIRTSPLRSTPTPFSKADSDDSIGKNETESLQVDYDGLGDGKKPIVNLAHKKTETKTTDEGKASTVIMKAQTKGKINDVNWNSLLQKYDKNSSIDSTDVKVTIPEKVFFVNPVNVEVSPPKPTTSKPEIITFKSFVEEFSTPKVVRRRPVYRPAPSTEVSMVAKTETQTQTNIVKRRRRPTLSPSSSPISTSTHGNHKYSGESFSNVENDGIKIIASPNLNTQPYRSQTTMETYEEKEFSPAVSSARPFELIQVTPASLLSNINLPEGLKHTLKLLNMDDVLNKIPNQIDDETQSPEFQTLPPMPDDFKNIIDSYVIYPSTTTTTTPASMPDLSHVANNLEPDMKELLMSFGLLPDPNPVQEPATVEQTVPGLDIAETNPDSYYKFKPLPKGGTIVTDMEEFLGRFGLGRDLKNKRDQKSISGAKETKLTTIPLIDLSGIPDSLKDTIKDLGLIDENKQITEENINTVLGKPAKENVKEKPKQTFKPTAASKDELEKLQNLLGIIKQLDRLNRTIGTSKQTEEDVKSLAKLVGNFNSQLTPLNEQNWAPNPLSEDDLGLIKNEVKRQQNSSAQVTIQVTAAITESPNIKGLEESFGGSEEVVQTVTIPPPISSTPNTGFYYLVDWNTFLDIDDQKGKRVNLRLQPKVGDPNKFLSVTVP